MAEGKKDWQLKIEEVRAKLQTFKANTEAEETSQAAVEQPIFHRQDSSVTQNVAGQVQQPQAQAPRSERDRPRSDRHSSNPDRHRDRDSSNPDRHKDRSDSERAKLEKERKRLDRDRRKRFEPGDCTKERWEYEWARLRQPAKPKRQMQPQLEIAGGHVERVYKLYYNLAANKWTKSEVVCMIEPKPFQMGSMRAAYRMTDLTKVESEREFVAKMSKNPAEDRKIYFLDVEMQSLASFYADEFNKYNPPKHVHFVDAFLIDRFEAEGQPIMAAEPYLGGKYEKHSDNWGYVHPDDRNTPHAFSHFTWCRSRGKLLIVDIQGVADKYTDPQIHSTDGKTFGKGNLGVQGIRKFFQTHRCNAICTHLRLPPHNPKCDDDGTKATAPKEKELNDAPLPAVELRSPMGGVGPRVAACCPVPRREYRSQSPGDQNSTPKLRDHSLPPEHYEQLVETFKRCDLDNRGMLDQGGVYRFLEAAVVQPAVRPVIYQRLEVGSEAAAVQIMKEAANGGENVDFRQLADWYGKLYRGGKI